MKAEETLEGAAPAVLRDKKTEVKMLGRVRLILISGVEYVSLKDILQLISSGRADDVWHGLPESVREEAELSMCRNFKFSASRGLHAVLKIAAARKLLEEVLGESTALDQEATSCLKRRAVGAPAADMLRFAKRRPEGVLNDDFYGAYLQVVEDYGKLKAENLNIKQDLAKQKDLVFAHSSCRPLGAHEAEELRWELNKAKEEITRLQKLTVTSSVSGGPSTGNTELDGYFKRFFIIGDISLQRSDKENDLFDAFTSSLGDNKVHVFNLMYKTLHNGKQLEKRERNKVQTTNARTGKISFSRCLQLLGGNMEKRHKTCNVFTNIKRR